MTEPETPGSDPTQLRTRAVRDGDGYVLDGHKWFTSNGSIADFLVVMAVTDPDAAPHRRASMFVVPVDTPGVNLVRDVPNMEQPVRALRDARRPHGDPVRERPARPRRAARQGGRRVPDRPAPARPGPDPPLHALARCRAARLRHDVRALALPAGQGRPAEGQADGAELDRRLGGRDAGGPADDAARGLEDRSRTGRARRAPTSR